VLRLSSEDAWSRAERASGSLRVIQARCAAAAERQTPLLIQGLRVRATLRCPKAKRSQTVKRRPVRAERREPRSGALDRLGSGAT
jgi:hypothetical protein